MTKTMTLRLTRSEACSLLLAIDVVPYYANESKWADLHDKIAHQIGEFDAKQEDK